MNDKDLENVFARMDDVPDVDARERALSAAMQAFDAVQAEKISATASQGFAAANRLTPERPSFGRRIMQLLTANNSVQRWLYSGMASAAVLVLGIFIALQLPQHSGVQIPTEMGSVARLNDVSVPAGALEYSASVGSSAGKAESDRTVAASAVSALGASKIMPTPDMDMGVAARAASPSALGDQGASQASMQFHSLEEVVISAGAVGAAIGGVADVITPPGYQDFDRDRFEAVEANPIKRTSEESVSTFSIDVDTASYSFVRRQLNAGVLPQKAAVRLEEMVNYFPYDYPLPQDRSQPFSTNVTVLDSPWKAGNKLVHIGIQGYELQGAQPRSNLVFLLDVSGSMDSPDKLPLVKQSMSLLLDRLQPQDTVAIVVYAGAAGTVLEPTQVKNKQQILAALNRLQAGGSTAGAEGIQLAYQLAESQFIKDGVNRIVLATDGDFNVGIYDPEELKGFVERKRESGVFLSVLGFGLGNYHDALMQTLAQNGNGIAAYIDTLGEAQKVLVDEATSALFPIAKDVKIQVEFNPATVSEYRLLGYETRILAEEDFNNDAVDAGDIGAGHSVTAIYEITPAGGESGAFSSSRYGEFRDGEIPASGANADEYGYLKLRYKLPGESKSRLISQPIGMQTQATPEMLREAHFATTVAGFAQLLEGGKYVAGWGYADALKLAQANRGDDPFGYRAEFVQLIRNAEVADAM
jgi:Ca-activated chloride channel family protein